MPSRRKQRRISDVSDIEADPVCTMDPMFRQGRMTQMISLTGMPLIPGTALIIYLAYELARTAKNYHVSKEVIAALDETSNTLNLVQVLLEEMDGVVSIIASGGTVILGEIRELYSPTDTSVKMLSPWLDNVNLSLSSALTEHRKIHTDLSNATIFNEVKFYSEKATEVGDAIYGLLDKQFGVTFWPVMVSYYSLLKAFQQVGLERSLGMVSFVQGNLTVDELEQYVGALELGNFHMDTAILYSPIVGDEYDLQYTSNNYLRAWLNTTRESVLQNDLSEPNLFGSLIWYRRLTSLLNIVRNIEHELSATGKKTIEDAHVDNIEIMCYCVIVMFCLMFLTSPFLFAIAYTTVSSLVQYAKTTDRKNFELKKEKRKTETLLNEMLPRAVAYRMRKGEEMEAESFDSVTVFFSDITDFTEISMISNPIDIVLFLNDFYQLIDTHVTKYDVYKVETISASYMVVSGLPSRNGTRHSIEIAKFSLDLMKLTETFEIPHLPDRILQLRIGCHTGRQFIWYELNITSWPLRSALSKNILNIK